MSKIQRRGVFMDSSIWIHYFRPRGDEIIKTEVKRVLLAEQVFTCWVVKAELLVGAKDEEAFTRLSSILEALEEIPLTPEVWLEAARLGYNLRRRAYQRGYTTRNQTFYRIGCQPSLHPEVVIAKPCLVTHDERRGS
jgi:predicted nucleic acid-binding protein